jgi:eukaryotic-like serine/threonine-protein kinase
MQLKGYSDLTELAEGGMAKVYKARQTSLNRTVAIKFLSAEYLWDNDAKTLFDQESLVIAQLNHPNIIHIIDRGLTEKGRPYFVMEFIQGDDLSVLMPKGQLSIKEKSDILMQICKGMACAHKNGVIHRDIKPANILIDADRHARVLDFGIAWLDASGHPEDIVGTPDYMSPEQFSAPESVTHLSDIYSLGVMMYELFRGKLPTAYFDDLKASMESLPEALSDLINECLQKDVTKRPQSADEIRLRLLKVLQGSHIKKNLKAEAETVVGIKKNNFVLLDVIKRDRFGKVYLFENKTKHSLLVIKKRVKTIAGFKEASMLSHIKHENLIKILGTSKNDNTFIVVMEHLTGGSLQDRLSRPYDIDSFKSIALSICSAMHKVHKHKIIHGNLRPSNILFDSNDKVKVTDFGFDEHYTGNRQEMDWYQLNDKTVDAKDRDLYSSGAIFYHMLTGAPVRFEHGRIQPDSLFDNLDEPLRNFLRKIMERGEDSKYKSFKQVISALRKVKVLHRNKIAATSRKIKPGKHSIVSFRVVFSIIFLVNAISIPAYFYLNPDTFKVVKIKANSWYSSIKK